MSSRQPKPKHFAFQRVTALSPRSVPATNKQAGNKITLFYARRADGAPILFYFRCTTTAVYMFLPLQVGLGIWRGNEIARERYTARPPSRPPRCRHVVCVASVRFTFSVTLCHFRRLSVAPVTPPKRRVGSNMAAGPWGSEDQSPTPNHNALETARKLG